MDLLIDYRIQRAWRAYLRRTKKHAASTHDEDLPSPDDASSSSGIQVLSSLSSPDDAKLNEDSDLEVDLHHDTGQGSKVEADPISDCSEMAAPIKAHLASVTADRALPREKEETEEAYARRLRKINLLSLAQEFAALKRIEPGAVPFEAASPMSEGSDMADSSGSASLASTPLGGGGARDINCNVERPVESKQANSNHRKSPETGETGKETISGNVDRGRLDNEIFDVYNIESTLPHVNWELLEEQLNRSAEEQKQQRVSIFSLSFKNLQATNRF